MEAIWESLLPQLGPFLVAAFGLVAGLAVKSGRRRRLDNLKAGAETLVHLTEPQDQAAVKGYMAAQSAALQRKTDPQLFYATILTVAAIFGAPVLYNFRKAPDTPAMEPWFLLPALAVGGLVAIFLAMASNIFLEFRSTLAKKKLKAIESAAAHNPVT